MFVFHRVKFNDQSIRIVRHISRQTNFLMQTIKLFIFLSDCLTLVNMGPRKFLGFTRHDNVAGRYILFMNGHDDIVLLLLRLQQGRDHWITKTFNLAKQIVLYLCTPSICKPLYVPFLIPNVAPMIAFVFP